MSMRQRLKAKMSLFKLLYKLSQPSRIVGAVLVTLFIDLAEPRTWHVTCYMLHVTYLWYTIGIHVGTTP